MEVRGCRYKIIQLWVQTFTTKSDKKKLTTPLISKSNSSRNKSLAWSGENEITISLLSPTKQQGNFHIQSSRGCYLELSGGQ